MPSVIARQFDVERPNQVLPVDITYIDTVNGFLYTVPLAMG